jgi:plastocyanin domain-containing protein
MNKTTWALTAAAILAAPLAGLAQQMGHDHTMHQDSGRAAPSGGSHAAAAPAPKGAARTVEMTVTSEGFVPAEVKVKKGEKLRLAITRKTEKTCATEIVVKDYGINQPLPLDKTVYVEFTPKNSGKVKYACGMDMITGFLIIE